MSITAADWIAHSTIDPAIFERWPAYRVILVAVDHADTITLADDAHRLLAGAHLAARSAEPGVVDPHTSRWHDAYRDFGIKPRVARPSTDALIRRAASDNGLPSINVLVDLYNAISILHRVPIGGEDLDRYDGPARLVIADGTEAFHTTSNGEPVVDHPQPGEPIWTDDTAITCRRWNWRQTNRTAIDHTTTRVGFIIDSLDAPVHAGATDAAEQLSSLLPGAVTRIIDPTTR
ncbi:MAG: B3/4 domain-containing protein [Ilumatobacteraceae bacterium]|jgi:DNA/RNA-binding domain of Phe-tRNA-synthetase-like protein